MDHVLLLVSLSNRSSQEIRWRTRAGFTLMELIIVMVIVGILTAIAIPNYSEYIARGNRSDAKATLLQVAQWQERVRSENNGYSTALPNGLTQSPASGPAKYTIGFSAAIPPTNNTYTIVATPTGTMATDRCGSFTLDQTSIRLAVIGGTSYGPGTPQYDGCWGR